MLKQESLQFRLTEVERRAHEILSKNKSPMDTKRLFPDYKDIDADLRYVAEHKKEFIRTNTPAQQEAKKLAELFEMLLAQLAELQNWFGDDVFIMETAEYDDIRAGIDAVIEILKDGAFSHLGLAVDVTFSEKQVEKKLERIRDEIDYYELPEVKYFISQSGDFKGRLSNIPRVVVAVNRKNLGELASLWLDLDFLRKRLLQATQEQNKKTSEEIRGRVREIQNKLAKHPLQIELLAQIELQLETFARYASSRSKSKKSEKFLNVLAIIRMIRNNKKDIENTPETKIWPMASFHQIDEVLTGLFPQPAADF
ncbi:MAG: hypothetical protein HY506_00315 [Candidatus Yanofskybacteria bacterium]|nr:hypothetical protein [Candidatus Yanofskybacteria bacterium]